MPEIDFGKRTAMETKDIVSAGMGLLSDELLIEAIVQTIKRTAEPATLAGELIAHLEEIV